MIKKLAAAIASAALLISVAACEPTSTKQERVCVFQTSDCRPPTGGTQPEGEKCDGFQIEYDKKTKEYRTRCMVLVPKDEVEK